MQEWTDWPARTRPATARSLVLVLGAVGANKIADDPHKRLLLLENAVGDGLALLQREATGIFKRPVNDTIDEAPPTELSYLLVFRLAVSGPEMLDLLERHVAEHAGGDVVEVTSRPR